MEEASKYKCPKCGSQKSYSNGKSKQGKPRRQCRSCGKYYTIGLERRKVSEEMWQMIWRMMDEEGVGLRAASRITGVSTFWINVQNKRRLANVPMNIENEDLSEDKKKPDHSDG